MFCLENSFFCSIFSGKLHQHAVSHKCEYDYSSTSQNKGELFAVFVNKLFCLCVHFINVDDCIVFCVFLSHGNFDSFLIGLRVQK